MITPIAYGVVIKYLYFDMPSVPWPIVKKYNNTHIEMKNKIKTSYAPPTSEVLELKTQGVICTSICTSTGVQDYGWNNCIEE